MERELLVLGLLMSQSQHGYQINEFIDRNLGQVSNMRKSTAYSILKRLEKGGLVESSNAQEGNRPVKQVYTITKQGEERFVTLLRKSLTKTDDTVPTGNIGIMFLDHLSLDEVIDCLSQRLEKVEETLTAYSKMGSHGPEFGLGIDLALQRQAKLVAADRDWLLETIAFLKKEGAKL